MNKLLLILFTLFLFNSISYSQIFPIGGFEKKEQVADDSIYYLVSLDQMYEIHANKGYRNVFTIKWNDFDSFSAEFQETSSLNKNEYKKGKSYSCSLIDKSTENLELKINSKSISLIPKSNYKVRSIMMKRDTSLHVKKHQQDSTQLLNGFRKMMKNSMKSKMVIDKNEIKPISYLFGTFKTYDYQSLDTICSPKFKKTINSKDLQFLTNYLKNVYGSWEYMYLFMQTLPMNSFSSVRSSKFAFKVKFKNYEEEVIVTLILSNENDIKEPIEGKDNAFKVISGKKTILGLNVVPPKKQESKFINSISKGFFDQFDNKKFEDIFTQSSPLLRGNSSKEEFVSYLNFVQSTLQNSPKIILTHQFGTSKNGALLSIMYEFESETKFCYLRLTYDSNNRLAGILFDKKEK